MTYSKMCKSVTNAYFVMQVDFSHPDCSSHGLIRASLETRDTTWHGYTLTILLGNFGPQNVEEYK